MNGPRNPLYMHLPSFIARPLFHAVYLRMRRTAPIPPIQRVVRPSSAEAQAAFDDLLDSALADGPSTLSHMD